MGSMYLDVFLDEYCWGKQLIGRFSLICINLNPSTQPVSIPSYGMASIELTKLRNQLDELIEKGFIRPSTSL